MSLSRRAQAQPHHPLPPIYSANGPPLFPSHPGSSIQVDCHLEGLLTEWRAHSETREWSASTGRCTSRMTIDMLPDIALLEIFEFYMNQAREHEDVEFTAKAWYTLVHVCRNWRTVVLASPRRLDLRLLCTDKTPVKEGLGVWPPLPIVIGQYIQPRRMDNIIMALEHNDRVRQIVLLGATNSQLEQVLAVTQQPFPALTELGIWLEVETKDNISEMLEDGPPVVPKSFLGGSAPRLQYLNFERIPFPGLPNLLSSASDLVTLHILEIPHSGYISPEEMVRCLSTLTRLKTLSLGFESPLSHPVRESQRPRPVTRLALPTLTSFWFEGVSGYLEDLVARIDAPLLDTLDIRFFHQLILDTPQLTQFVARTPSIQPPVEARITFYDHYVEVTSPRTSSRKLELGIRCRPADWQLSSLAQVCSSSFPEAFIHAVEHLRIDEHKYLEPRWQDDIEDSQWSEVLHPFTTVKHLYLSREFTPRIALQELSGEVLPSLQNLFLEDLDTSEPVQEGIGKFIAARQLANDPVAVFHWDRKPYEW